MWSFHFNFSFFALSQGWLTELGQTHKPAGAAQPLHTYEQGDTKTRLDFALVTEAFRAAVGNFEVVQRNLVPKKQRAQDHFDLGHLRTEGGDDETTHDSECGRPATPGTHLSEKMETGEPRVRTGHHGSKEQQAAKKKERSDERSLASDHGRLCAVNADPYSSETEIHAAQGQNSEILHPGKLAKLLSK